MGTQARVAVEERVEFGLPDEGELIGHQGGAGE